jgi:hypothetical protein
LKNIAGVPGGGVTAYGEVVVTVVHGPERLVASTKVPPAGHVKVNEPLLNVKLTDGGAVTVKVAAVVGVPEPLLLLAVRR